MFIMGFVVGVGSCVVFGFFAFGGMFWLSETLDNRQEQKRKG